MKYIKYLVNYIISFGYDIYFYFFGDIRSRIQGLSYYQASKLYPGYLKHGNMVEAVASLAKKFCIGKGIDVGASNWLLPGARAVENNPAENAYQIQEANSSLDFVFSSHCLEHLKEWEKALTEWYRVLKPGGILFLYLPHSACAMWKPGVNPGHLWAPTSEDVSKFLEQNLKISIVERTFNPDGYLSFYIIARK